MPSSTRTLGEEPLHLGEDLQGRMADQGITLQEMARRSCVPVSTLNRKLNVEPDKFTLSELRRIAWVLGTTAGALVTEHEAA